MIKIETNEIKTEENKVKKADIDSERSQEVEAEKTAENDDAYAELSKEELVDLVKQKDAELSELNDRYLRLAAELDNARKRFERERQEAIAYANEQIIRELLPVIDNLERAVQHADEDTDVKSLLEGVEITLRSFLATLERFGCKPFESVGKPFDPAYHEAIMQQETNDHPENTVVQEYQKGYVLNDRLLRPAMVVVAKQPKEEADGDGNQ
ncbi:MAG TPA: nucleotide exchange factor GrpE [Thermodesulforhabdus norvegica]|uniref:Protein GrpE n=1 Tax=Thermodesulforhabdus norvegica TaxID=39841 RepID=A0A7C0WT37_9BACT|nr:nucleotide exchange factor GrpE [Deltaproteobacteria bacterium]MBW2067324.1 nucleotide exchange factor GrpE [Deltaproteobacteria bacterium]HDL90684.1 nucleotide exchange factor GrpE [Thermodesulforhabdus norvegica]